jgi:hypothetical protein
MGRANGSDQEIAGMISELCDGAAMALLTNMDEEDRLERVFFFQFGIRQLEEVYRISIDGMAAKRTEHEKELRQLQDPKMQEEIESRYSEESIEPEYAIQFKIEQNEESLQPLRQAFLMALYHHWERSVLSWSGRSDLVGIYSWFRENNIPLDEQHMEDLRELMRVIKHEKGESLFRRRPDLFLHGSQRHEDLHLTEDNMAEFFKAVRVSGLQPLPMHVNIQLF